MCRYGYCGKGEGFCTPATRPTTPAPPPEGCLLEDTEIVGGDLEAGRGGGGLGVATAELCGERCRVEQALAAAEHQLSLLRPPSL